MSTLLLLVTQDEAEPPVIHEVAFDGAGALVVDLLALSGQRIDFSGSGALAISAATMRETFPSPLAGTGEGTLAVDGQRNVVAEMQLFVLDDELTRAPTSITVLVLDGWSGAPVEFDIDGTVIATNVLDSQGALGPISLPVDTGAAGSHLLTVTSTGTQASTASSATFTLRLNPSPLVQSPGPDADPVDIPAAHTSTGVTRWVLQDLMPGGLGSWVMPANPASMAPLPFRRTLSQEHSTAIAGKYHITEAGAEAHEWEFSGYLATQDAHDKLLAYANLKRRFYLIDHRSRAWVVTLLGVNLIPRRRTANSDGTFNDWGHDYSVSALVYTSLWKVPQ